MAHIFATGPLSMRTEFCLRNFIQQLNLRKDPPPFVTVTVTVAQFKQHVNRSSLVIALNKHEYKKVYSFNHRKTSVNTIFQVQDHQH